MQNANSIWAGKKKCLMVGKVELRIDNEQAIQNLFYKKATECSRTSSGTIIYFEKLRSSLLARRAYKISKY
jgi:hypothetical protein